MPESAVCFWFRVDDRCKQ